MADTQRSRSGLKSQADTTYASGSAVSISNLKQYQRDQAESVPVLNDNNTHTGSDEFADIRITEGNELTISSGLITPTNSRHSVDTESDASTDDLDNITATDRDGQLLVLKPANDARTIVAKNGTGNLRLNGDFSMDNLADRLILICDDGKWYELSRSANTGT